MQRREDSALQFALSISPRSLRDVNVTNALNSYQMDGQHSKTYKIRTKA